jgi:hypothetical protein
MASAVGHINSLKKGDVSVCAYCAQPLQWNGEGWEKLEGPSLVLARLNEDFLWAEQLARQTREHFRGR